MRLSSAARLHNKPRGPGDGVELPWVIEGDKILLLLVPRAYNGSSVRSRHHYA